MSKEKKEQYKNEIFLPNMCIKCDNINAFFIYSRRNEQIYICRHYRVVMIEIEVCLLLICQTSIVIDRFPTISQT